MFFSSGRKLYHSPFPQVATIGEKWFTDKGSNDTGSTDKGSNDTGSNDKGSNNTGSNDKGSKDTGSNGKNSQMRNKG